MIADDRFFEMSQLKTFVDTKITSTYMMELVLERVKYIVKKRKKMLVFSLFFFFFSTFSIISFSYSFKSLSHNADI